jgi:hypothetical protein
MPRSPIPVKEVLEYLKLEDAEGLVPGSVKYVGSVDVGNGSRHYWSYPLNGRLAWALLDEENCLGDAERVPAEIRTRTAPLSEHRIQRPLPLPKRPWVGRNLPDGSLPVWVPSSQIHMWDLSFVAAFPYDFEKALKVFGAKATSDKYNGGAGPARFFFLELARSRLARLEWEERHPDRIDLYLTQKSGVSYWDEYDQIMTPLDVPLERAFRQGGVHWKHRNPTPEATARTQGHHQRMWMPKYKN